jgi:hypothetical protein
MFLGEHGYKFTIKYQLSQRPVSFIIYHRFGDNFGDIFAKRLYRGFKLFFN